MRTALPIAEAMLTLRRSEALAATPSAIDDTLALQLVRIRQGRLRFDHERLARFLAAEHLVLSAADGAALAQLINQPAHRDLRHDALLAKCALTPHRSETHSPPRCRGPRTAI